MSASAPTGVTLGSARRYTVIGGVLGAVLPLFCASVALWMKETPNPLVAGALAGWRSVIPSAILAAVVGRLTHSAHEKFGRDAILPIVLTYGFLATAMLFFIFLAPE